MRTPEKIIVSIIALALTFCVGFGIGTKDTRIEMTQKIRETEHLWFQEVKRVRHQAIVEMQSKLHEHAWVFIKVADPDEPTISWCTSCGAKQDP